MIKMTKKYFSEKKAQGAIEYLLIIGAAILVVAIVSISMVGVTTGGLEKTDADTIRDTTLILECQKECIQQGHIWNGINCEVETSEKCNEFGPNPN